LSRKPGPQHPINKLQLIELDDVTELIPGSVCLEVLGLGIDVDLEYLYFKELVQAVYQLSEKVTLGLSERPSALARVL
jgi:hypothetical protein